VLRESSLSLRQSYLWKPALSILPSEGAAVPDVVYELSPTMHVKVSDASKFAFSVVVGAQELVFVATDDTDRGG
jgi:hypothetical protein